MAWEKSSADLVVLFREITPEGPNIQQKPMFGYPCAFVNGNLFAGLFRESMMFRLSPSDQAAFLDLPGTAEFEPMPGRRMKGYVLYIDPLSGNKSDLANWMRCAEEFASHLPPKKKAAAKKKAPAKKTRPKA